MPRYASKSAPDGVPVTVDRDRYQGGEYPSPVEGSVPLAISPSGKTIPIQVTPEGYLQVYNEGSSSSGDVEQHQEGDSDSNVYGIAVLGDDGSVLHILKVDANGKLQVASDTDIVQYQSGAAETAPVGTVALGYDGSDVRAVAVDSNGYLQVSGTSGGGDEQHTDGDSGSGAKGNLILGDDGTDLQTIRVDTDGKILIGNFPTGINVNNFPTGFNVNNPNEQHAQGDSGVNAKGNLVLGDKAGTLTNITLDPRGSVRIANQGAEFYVGPDVSLSAGSTTKIAGAYAGRHGFIVGNLASNTDIFRIGDSTTDATHGIELAPGETMYIQTDAAIYGYNPGSAAQSVCVGGIED